MVRAWLNRTRPETHKRRSRHCAIETLEDRLTPASLHFVPIADVFVNPQPLPPSAVVEFDPLVEVPPGPTQAQSTSGPIVVAGHLALSGQAAGTAAAAPMSWTLDVFYSLAGQASVSEQPPGPSTVPPGPQVTTASYALAGEEFAVLTVHGPGGTQQVLQVDGVSVDGSLSPSDPDSHAVTGKRVWSEVTLTRGVVSSPLFGAWIQQVQCDSAGAVTETEEPTATGGASLSASFTQSDSLSACLMPQPATGHPPNPCYQIDATFGAVGTVSENIILPGPGPVVVPLELVDGAVQYQGQLDGAVTLPDGTTQPLGQGSSNQGSYRAIHIES